MQQNVAELVFLEVAQARKEHLQRMSTHEHILLDIHICLSLSLSLSLFYLTSYLSLSLSVSLPCGLSRLHAHAPDSCQGALLRIAIHRRNTRPNPARSCSGPASTRDASYTLEQICNARSSKHGVNCVRVYSMLVHVPVPVGSTLHVDGAKADLAFLDELRLQWIQRSKGSTRGAG